VLAEDNLAIENLEANSQCLELLESVQAAIRAGDVSAIRNAAEALKGPLTSVFANEAFAAASALENTMHEGDLTRAREACRRLRAIVNGLNPACKTER
jgi:hypothetical protein